MDQRDWVGFSGLSEKYRTAALGQQIAGSVITNTGKTPARRVNAIIVIYEEVASRSPDISDEKWMNNMITLAESARIQGNDRKMFNRIPFPPGLVEHSRPFTLAIGTLAPNDSQPLLGVGEAVRVARETEPDFYPTNTVVIFGQIRYQDIFGVVRKTTFCSRRRAGPEMPFSRCSIYNDME